MRITMEIQHVQLVAGIASSSMFVIGTLPMLLKAFRTRDLKSYSLGNIALSNLGNLVHWIYVASLPLGPIWFLHVFSTVATGLMLFWYVRYAMQCNLARLPECLGDWRACRACVLS
jgi:uncharacterized protein with PQ loop repeat